MYPIPGAPKYNQTIHFKANFDFNFLKTAQSNLGVNYGALINDLVKYDYKNENQRANFSLIINI